MIIFDRKKVNLELSTDALYDFVEEVVSKVTIQQVEELLKEQIEKSLEKSEEKLRQEFSLYKEQIWNKLKELESK